MRKRGETFVIDTNIFIHKPDAVPLVALVGKAGTGNAAGGAGVEIFKNLDVYGHITLEKP